ncbi:MAG: squalene--hopene cyclase [Acidobacteria bacterium]|nr:squalene--hopene cyclase [Acidobacteriota bacterium]
MSPGLQITDSVAAGVAQAIAKASDWLLGQQSEKGYWWGDLTADTTLESDYILLQLWLYPPQNGTWNPITRVQIDRAVRSILDRQCSGGGFSIYTGGPSDVSASVKAYFALKLAGIDPNAPAMTRLRECILSHGGLQAANSYVKINLGLFNLYPKEHIPSVPPEMILMGRVLYHMSAWARAIVVPLAIVQSLNKGRPTPAGFTVDELFAPGVSKAFPCPDSFFSWKSFFLGVDKLCKLWEKYGSKSIRNKAIEQCKQWVLDRTRYTDGLAAIYPPMMYTIMALDLLGHAPGDPDRDEAEQQFLNLMVDDGKHFYFQPCFSVVWDTAIAAHALAEAGTAPPHSLARAAEWLVGKEVRKKGDWSVHRPGVEPSGWYFEFANEYYPDIDDTGMVVIALAFARASDGAAQQATIKRALNWLIAMQAADGGWAAFDVDNNWPVLTHVPFADHNAMLDPTCPDITGRVLEGMALHGIPADHPAMRRGVDYLIRVQEQDGSWYGRWGVDYIYGTYLALRGLRAAGESDREVHVLRAGEWLRAIQNADGGWGESPESYTQSAYVNAPSTPSQTAWALLGLIASGDGRSDSIERAAEYLIRTQRPDGTWDEPQATGTGFPRVFYLNYHMYRNSFPLLALATFLKLRQQDN